MAVVAGVVLARLFAGAKDCSAAHVHAEQGAFHVDERRGYILYSSKPSQQRWDL